MMMLLVFPEIKKEKKRFLFSSSQKKMSRR